MNKIIFLDVDGVLNSEEIADFWHEKTGKNGYGGYFKEEDIITDQDVKWGQSAVDNLKRIVEETGASIVISSTWRKYFTVTKFMKMFSIYGWDTPPIIGKTPVMDKKFSHIYSAVSRGSEIKDAVETINPDKYVILDDDTDMLPQQEPYFVNTDPIVGLTSADADKAIKILNG